VLKLRLISLGQQCIAKNKTVAVPHHNHSLKPATPFSKNETDAQGKNMQQCFGHSAKLTASTNWEL
jgi:hypothetical protein